MSRFMFTYVDVYDIKVGKGIDLKSFDLKILNFFNLTPSNK